MNTIERLTPAHGPGATEPAGGVSLGGAQRLALGDFVGEIASLIGFVFVAGPPVVVVAAPWLLLGLMLIGAFAVLVALVAVSVVAALLLATLAGVLAAPYLLLRGLHRMYRRSRAVAVPRAHVARLEQRRVVA